MASGFYASPDVILKTAEKMLRKHPALFARDRFHTTQTQRRQPPHPNN